MAAQKLAVEAALARRMFHAPRLYRWVLRNLQELPAEGGERDYYCQMARAVRVFAAEIGTVVHDITALHTPPPVIPRNSTQTASRPDPTSWPSCGRKVKKKWIGSCRNTEGAA